MFRFFLLSLLALPLPLLAAPPAAPANFTVTSTRPTMVTLAWQDNSADETGFEILRRTGMSGPFTSIGLLAANTITAVNNNVMPQTTYQYQIRSYKNPGPEVSVLADSNVVNTPAYLVLPALLGPVISGTAPSSQVSTAGSLPLALPVGGVFSDPDVSSAARLATDFGNIDFVFLPTAAPLTVTNFLNYLNRGDFNNCLFHRSVPGLFLQAGGFRADATASAIPTNPPILNEPLISNTRGTVAMAKRDNSPNSATNQFFINLANNAGFLNAQNSGFSVFARVAGSGMTVADAIAALPVQDYTGVNGALAATPYRIPPATPYNVGNLVRILTATPISPLTLSVASSSPEIASAMVNSGNLILTAISPGVSTITLTATDLDGLTGTTSFSFTVGPMDYQSWSDQQGFVSAAEALPGADPDQDGRSNLLEFTLASPPLASSAADLLPSISSGKLTLRFPLRLHTSGVNVFLESNESLQGPWTVRWATADGFPHPWISSVAPIGNVQFITAQNPDGANLPRQFLRLRVTKP